MFPQMSSGFTDDGLELNSPLYLSRHPISSLALEKVLEDIKRAKELYGDKAECTSVESLNTVLRQDLGFVDFGHKWGF